VQYPESSVERETVGNDPEVRIHMVDLKANKELRCSLCVSWDCEKCPYEAVVLQ